MTRINLIDPSSLTDQHIMAEYRELPRVFGLSYKRYLNGKKFIPVPSYRLATGHVMFFYDKLDFLINRQHSIIKECLNRGFKISNTNVECPIIPGWMNNWIPSIEDVNLSISRLDERLLDKVSFYKHYGSPVQSDFYSKYIR